MPIETFLSGLALVVLLATLVLLILLINFRKKNTDSSIPQDFPSRPKRVLAHLLRLFGFAIFVILLLAGGLIVYVDQLTMASDLAPAPSEVEIPPDLPFQVEEVRFAGGDGLKLAGWYTPPANGVTIILLHGYGTNRLGMRWHAEKLVEAGYGVLMYDERASGESDGQRRSYGWEDAPDVGGALDFLNSRTPGGNAKVGIVGCSIGGQIALQAAARYPQIAATWADGPSAVQAKDIRIYSWQSFLSRISSYILDRMYIWNGITAPPAIVDTIGTIEPRSVTLIAGARPHSAFGPEYLHVEYYMNYAGKNTSLWIIPQAMHCDGPSQIPEEYTHRMLEFFDKVFETVH
jgi:pimeloyl-ACP methyl ester carboxylesterase